METVIALATGVVGGVLGLIVVHRTFPTDLVQWLAAFAVGLAGGWFGRWLLGIFGLEAVSWLGALVIAFLGAVAIFMLVNRAARRGRPAA